MSNALLNRLSVAGNADELLPEYREIIANIPPEAGHGGIWESEMFLFYAAIKPFAPKQILESGRARGKSTLILARCFPESRIISVEYERQSENSSSAISPTHSSATIRFFNAAKLWTTSAIPVRIHNAAMASSSASRRPSRRRIGDCDSGSSLPVACERLIQSAPLISSLACAE